MRFGGLRLEPEGERWRDGESPGAHFRCGRRRGRRIALCLNSALSLRNAQWKLRYLPPFIARRNQIDRHLGLARRERNELRRVAQAIRRGREQVRRVSAADQNRQSSFGRQEWPVDGQPDLFGRRDRFFRSEVGLDSEFQLYRSTRNRSREREGKQYQRREDCLPDVSPYTHNASPEIACGRFATSFDCSSNECFRRRRRREWQSRRRQRQINSRQASKPGWV